MLLSFKKFTSYFNDPFSFTIGVRRGTQQWRIIPFGSLVYDHHQNPFSAVSALQSSVLRTHVQELLSHYPATTAREMEPRFSCFQPLFFLQHSLPLLGPSPCNPRRTLLSATSQLLILGNSFPFQLILCMFSLGWRCCRFQLRIKITSYQIRYM